MTFIASTLAFPVTAQESQVIQNLQEGEQTAIEAIALYPQKERSTILTATMYPQILARMDQIRRYTEAEFKEVISPLSVENQKRVYNLARYPALLKLMSDSDDSWSRSDMRDLLRQFPEEIHDDAVTLNRKEFAVVKHVNVLLAESEIAFDKILDAYPDTIKQVFRELEKLPEVVSILNDHMSLTVLLGDLYENNEEALLHTLDSLNSLVAEEKVSEFNAWKEALENDPDAMYEYEQAAREFADEQGYNFDVYTDVTPDRYPTGVQVRYIWRPYPYWFGWPGQDEYELWYPDPWWPHWGFYHARGNTIVLVWLPSNDFLSWHFRYYRHLCDYPHFTDLVIRHFSYGPRRYDSSVNTVVRDWQNAHKGQLPKGWFKDDGNRAKRIQEFARFKLDYQTAVNEVYAVTPSEQDYLRDNANYYPTLKPVLKESTRPRPQQYVSERGARPDTYQPRDMVIDRSKTFRQEEVKRAVEQHENTWKHMTRNPSRATSPSPRSAPKSPAPRPSSGKKNN